MNLTQACVCLFYDLAPAVCGQYYFFYYFFSKREGDLAAEEERKPPCTLRPQPVKHLRWQFAFPGGQRLPGRRERGKRGGQSRPGLQVLTEAGIVPSGEGGGRWGGDRKGHEHIVNIYMHTLRLSHPAPPLHQPPNLFLTPRLSVCVYPLSQLKAWTPSIPQACVRKRSPGDQGPSGV